MAALFPQITSAFQAGRWMGQKLPVLGLWLFIQEGSGDRSASQWPWTHLTGQNSRCSPGWKVAPFVVQSLSTGALILLFTVPATLLSFHVTSSLIFSSLCSNVTFSLGFLWSLYLKFHFSPSFINTSGPSLNLFFPHLLFLLFGCIIWLSILVPLGIEPGSSAVKAQSPNHWTAKEFSLCSPSHLLLSLYTKLPYFIMYTLYYTLVLPGGASGKELTCQRKRHKRCGFDSWEDPLEEEMSTRSSILAWRIPWTEEPGGLQFIGLQRVGHDWSNLASILYHILQYYSIMLHIESLHIVYI